MRAVIHIDGSSMPVPGSRRCSLGWGLVALHDDRHFEESGHLVVDLPTPLLGLHEQLAFGQAVRYIFRLGVPLSSVTIFCDDEVFGYAPFHLHSDNHLQVGAERVRTRLRHVADALGAPELYAQTMEVFAHARICKLLGHRQEVYQERSDYLAKHGALTGKAQALQDLQALQAGGEPMELPVCVPYEDWIQNGFLVYEREHEERRRQYPAFCAPSGG